jgi:membrane protease YdiL (CAAX protease family)
MDSLPTIQATTLTPTIRWRSALYVFGIWIVLTLAGSLISTGGQQLPLQSLIRDRFALGVLFGSIWMLIAITSNRWWPMVGVARPHDVDLLWLPFLALVVYFALNVARGSFASPTTGLVALNTLLVGVSEELMFRGVLIEAALAKFSARIAVLLVAVVFGAMHSLNALLTGDVGLGLGQAGIAMVFGLWATSLRVRTGSVLPLIAIHWGWDFLLVVGIGSVGLALSAFGFIGALFVYGIVLFAGVRDEAAE